MKVWMKLTEAELADTIAKSYLDDVTHVVDNDRRMLEFALDRAAKARGLKGLGETKLAEGVGHDVLHSLEGMLSEGQRFDPVGHVLTKFLGHVPVADLGSYYLRKYDEQQKPAQERLIDSGKWNITATLHGEDCAPCMDAAESAAIHAAVTGSVGATWGIEHSTSVDGEVTVDHQATVRRNRDGDGR